MASKQFVRVDNAAAKQISHVPAPSDATRFGTMAQAQVAAHDLGLGPRYSIIGAIPTRDELIADALTRAKPHTDAINAARAAQRKFGGDAQLIVPETPNPPASPNATTVAPADPSTPIAPPVVATAPGPTFAVSEQTASAATPPAPKTSPTNNNDKGGNVTIAMTKPAGSLHAFAQRFKATRANLDKAVADLNARLDTIEAEAPQALTDAHGAVSAMQGDLEGLTSGLAADIAELKAAVAGPLSVSAPVSAPVSSPAPVEAAAPIAPIPMQPIASPEPVKA